MNRRNFVKAGFAALGAAVVVPRMRSTPAEAADFAFDEPALGVGVTAGSAVTGADEIDPMVQEIANELRTLVAPLEDGSKLADSTLRQIYVDPHGVGVAIVESPNGQYGRLDICRRDGDLDVTPLARTDRYELYIRNGGDGHTSTEREMILAAWALGDVIASNESNAKLELVSKREFWGEFA